MHFEILQKNVMGGGCKLTEQLNTNINSYNNVRNHQIN